MELLEMKNTVSEMKNIMAKINSRVGTAGGKKLMLEDIVINVIQKETERENKN